MTNRELVANAITPFRRFTDYSGRSTRPEFWLFVALLVVTMYVVMPLAMFSNRWFLLAIWAALTLPPYIAVLVRRLHDTDRSGAWAAPYVILLTVGGAGFAIMRQQFDQGEGGFDTGLFNLMFLNNALYVICTVIMIVFVCQPGTSGPNRFGPPPSIG